LLGRAKSAKANAILFEVTKRDENFWNLNQLCSGAAGAVKRLALAMVSLRVRAAVRDCGVEPALHSVSRALVALNAAVGWRQSASVHVLSGPRLARLAEKRLESLREAVKDARDALANLRDLDNSRLPSGASLDSAVAAASAALAVVRAARGTIFASFAVDFFFLTDCFVRSSGKRELRGARPESPRSDRCAIIVFQRTRFGTQIS
jgi:hypothetical protein